MTIRIKFDKPWARYNIGDIAGFDDKRAKQLIASGIGQQAGPPDGNGKEPMTEVPRERTFEHRGHGSFRVFDIDGVTVLADGLTQAEARDIRKNGMPDASG